ncbi:histidine--tRNA ligase [Bombilactobacillus thymidiniphilus]|uniref:Histidine--tRNA ligase n=1 Tax=Bombilactobacillus thymidiniphilus TaxID=2923363 RepID=A0ABY4PCP5_9LACO|nr:histidine--tRNA ligase [Bombilactobacillus thymidiniphilus]UQS83533.1 histidine--tRNA ligase [Bombilactobacillus thymidiniphilus]
MRYQKPKGTLDILPGESQKWQYVENVAQQIFSKYQYQEIRTPIFEQYEVFARSSGDTSDIVSKEMYDFEDKGGRRLALRPEGTAGVVRSYVENKLFGPEHNNPYKVWYHGPMFRYERPQSGRQRQFHQIGVEALGSDAPEMDVETISMALNFLNELGLKDYKVVLNTLGDVQTRKNYHQALLDYLTPLKEQLSADSQIRLMKNPLRILDSKEAQDQKLVADAPSILDYLTDAAKKHFQVVTNLLDQIGVAYEIDANMVRGLDYYNHTIFEIMVTSPAFDNREMTVIAGGRYNGLVAQLGGPDISGVGFGLGLERLMLLLEQANNNLPEFLGPDIYLVDVNDADSAAVSKLLTQLRQAGISAERDYLHKKVKGQFKQANRLHAKFTLTIGDEELATKKAQLKRMADGSEFTVDLTDLSGILQQIKKG